MRAVSWWVEWADLELGNPGIHDKIKRRAERIAEASADTAIIFGAHFRWDFLPYWNLLHVYFSEVADTLKQYGIRLFDHHSATLTHRYESCGEMKRTMLNMIHHLPMAPSIEAAADWKYNGEYLNSWRVIDAQTGKPAKIRTYTAEQFCINHPGFVAAYCKYLGRLVPETGIAGLMCDDMVYFGGFYTCSCPCCRARLGFELPPAHDTTFWGNWGNSRWLEYLAMRRDSIGRFLEAVKAALPENFPLMSCCTSGAYGGNNYSAQSVHELSRGDNIINLELCGNNPADVCERLAAGSYQAGAAKKYGLPVTAIGYGFYPDSAEHLWALNHMTGFSTWFSTLKGRLGLSKELLGKLPDDFSPASRAFAFEQAHPELFSGHILYECGVYFSENTKTDSYFGACEQGATRDYRELIRKLLVNGVRAETVFDFPRNASECPCVIVPSAAVFKPEEQSAMESYLENGGRILRFGPDDLAGLPSSPEQDFASLRWLKEQQFAPGVSVSGRWTEVRPGLFRNPSRNPAGLLELVRSLTGDRLPAVEAPGFAVTIRENSIHLLALNYDIELDRELEAMRLQHSHVELIRRACPRDCARHIRVSVPVKAVHCPLGGQGGAVRGGILLEGSPMYVIAELEYAAMN